MRRGIIGGGNFIVDYVKTIDHYPAEETLAEIRHEHMGSGGAPYNVLLDLAKLGASVPLSAIGRIGDDEAGRFILRDCQAHGIDTSGLKTTPAATTSYTLVAVVEQTGKRTFFHQRGANALLSPSDFDFTHTEASHLHYGYVLLLDKMDGPDAEFGTGAARVLAAAKQAGLTTSIDLVSEDSERFRQVLPHALRYADIAFMNEFEAERSTGIRLLGAGPAQMPELYEALQFDGTLVVHWPDGAAACNREGIVWQSSVDLPSTAIVSSVGSGDAFAAGYLLGFTRGASVQNCLALGVCAAASCLMGYTCADAVCSEADCIQLGERYGFRPV